MTKEDLAMGKELMVANLYWTQTDIGLVMDCQVHELRCLQYAESLDEERLHKMTDSFAGRCC